MNRILSVFIGYDPREPVAYNVCSHSLLTKASKPVSVTPVMLSQLTDIFSREKDPLQSTEFSFSRFLVPYLSNYEGWSLFIDGDMIITDDIWKLWELRDEQYAVQVVKHNHKPIEETKFLNATQTKYKMKNWSSVMLFNNSLCKALTPGYINTASGLELHQFHWLSDLSLVGELPTEWNYLADYTTPLDSTPSLIHYTKGGPYFREYRDCEFNNLWFEEFERATFADQLESSKFLKAISPK